MRRRRARPAVTTTSPSRSAPKCSSARSASISARADALRETPLILIVDDNAANLDILEARLSSRGYATASAVNGTQALEQVRSAKPDLVLLDIMMPEIDGIEVCRRIKADAELPFIPIILVTAKADSKDVVA